MRGQETPTKIQPLQPAPEHALRVCAAGPGCRRCLVRTWRGLGRDSGAGRWLNRDFPATAAQDSFFFFPFSQEAATARGEEEKEASPAGANAALRLCGRSVPAPMSPRRASRTVPRREWGAEPCADGEWPRVSRLACPPSRQPAGGCPGLCVLNYLQAAFRLPAAGASPRALPGARGRGGGAGDRAGLCAPPAAGSAGSRQRPGPGEGT